jgi:two-component system, OmpR family, phosphate regulon sensor histidine kinase PhoR
MALSAIERTISSSDVAHDVLRGILNASRESVLVVDSSMRITASNDPANEAFGRQMETFHERRLSEIIRNVSLHEGFQHTLNNNEPTDLRIDFNGIEKRAYDVHIAPIELDGDRHAIGVFYDITQIERLEKVRQEFLSNISHELRTPLTSIIAYVETLQDGAINEPENNQRFLGVIRRNAERMNALIADIAELSMIETGNISLDVRQVRLSQAVDEIFAALSSKAAERNVSLVNRVAPEAYVRADMTRLEQMLTNLVDNAIKFNRENGTVTVLFSNSSGKSLISVIDTGEGIVPENLQRIFERFYRIDRGRTREVGGTGLGLAIVKHLARLHGGEVFVASTLGRGTTFSIELPA